MYNSLDAPLNVDIEMNMTGDRPSRMVPNFSKLILLKHPFEHGQERNILVFAKEEVSLWIQIFVNWKVSPRHMLPGKLEPSIRSWRNYSWWRRSGEECAKGKRSFRRLPVYSCSSGNHARNNCFARFVEKEIPVAKNGDTRSRYVCAGQKVH